MMRNIHIKKLVILFYSLKTRVIYALYYNLLLVFFNDKSNVNGMIISIMLGQTIGPREATYVDCVMMR